MTKKVTLHIDVIICMVRENRTKARRLCLPYYVRHVCGGSSKLNGKTKSIEYIFFEILFSVGLSKVIGDNTIDKRSNTFTVQRICEILKPLVSNLYKYIVKYKLCSIVKLVNTFDGKFIEPFSHPPSLYTFRLWRAKVFQGYSGGGYANYIQPCFHLKYWSSSSGSTKIKIIYDITRIYRIRPVDRIVFDQPGRVQVCHRELIVITTTSFVVIESFISDFAPFRLVDQHQVIQHQ